jgi:hypothetical protein
MQGRRVTDLDHAGVPLPPPKYNPEPMCVLPPSQIETSLRDGATMAGFRLGLLLVMMQVPRATMHTAKSEPRLLWLSCAHELPSIHRDAT